MLDDKKFLDRLELGLSYFPSWFCFFLGAIIPLGLYKLAEHVVRFIRWVF